MAQDRLAISNPPALETDQRLIDNNQMEGLLRLQQEPDSDITKTLASLGSFIDWVEV